MLKLFFGSSPCSHFQKTIRINSNSNFHTDCVYHFCDIYNLVNWWLPNHHQEITFNTFNELLPLNSPDGLPDDATAQSIIWTGFSGNHSKKVDPSGSAAARRFKVVQHKNQNISITSVSSFFRVLLGSTQLDCLAVMRRTIIASRFCSPSNIVHPRWRVEATLPPSPNHLSIETSHSFSDTA